MCQFVSWKEKDKQVFFLTNKDLKGRKFNEFKKENKGWKGDICGHGAIEWFYPALKTIPNKECDDFSTPSNFPQAIVNAIKNRELTNIGYDVGLLNEKGRKKYKKIAQSAKEEYWKIAQPAWEVYLNIQQLARGEYDKLKQSAKEEYRKIEKPAWEEYEKIVQSAFWKIFKQKKYRNPKWI